jgi:flagellar biosynthesis protein FlhF
MQVKKFEARNMKDALEMVKVQLGPDAIILGVRDNKKSFGLVGEGSIEITAAVSNETLQRKKFAEAKLREEDRNKLLQSPARVQKQFINKVVDNYTKEKEPPKPITRTRYIDIVDELEGLMSSPANTAHERIRGAAQRAWDVFKDVEDKNINNYQDQQNHQMHQSTQSKQEIDVLKHEIASLRQVIKTFQSMPQSIQNGPAITVHPGADYGLSFEVSGMFEKLTNAGISNEVAAEILTTAQNQMPAVKMKSKALVDAWVAKFILETTKIVNEKKPTKMQIFVGPTGAGKTSTLVKLASHFVVNEKKKIAVISLDTFKVGAAEQLKIFSQILNVPFAIVRNANDWQHMMNSFSQFDHILIDFPGMTLKTIEENTFVRGMLPPNVAQSTIHLVLEATAKDQDITEIGRRYKPIGFQDVIFTNLDQSVQHGTIYNFMRKFEVPLHSFGLGPRVPEDYEMATKERVLDLIFKLTSLKPNNSKV